MVAPALSSVPVLAPALDAVAGATALLQNSPAGTRFTVTNVLNALVVLVVAYLLAATVTGLLTRLADRFARQRFRVTVLIPVAKFLIYGGAIYLVLAFLFELTTTQLVAFAGLLGAALGLGLKDLLADVVGGMVVVVEQPFQVGDKVTLGDHYGEVVDIGLRSTKIVTPNDTAVVVPNFVLFNDSVANANTSDAEMLVVVEFFVDPDADVARATAVVEEALVTSPYVYVDDDHPATVVVEDDLYYRTVQGKAYVSDLRREVPFTTDVTERVLDTFDREGIDSPAMPAGSGAVEVDHGE